MILRDGKILLGKRHDDPEKASSLMHGEGTRTMPGGKMDYGETFEQLVAREVMEETGMTIDTTNLKVISVTNDIVHDNHFITIGFLCEDIE
jgi:ADP-ribose pyrophosphatase YjhB (NUDIX family)